MAGTWSATKRPRLDLDFADAFAGQMMALARQNARLAQERDEFNRKAQMIEQAKQEERKYQEGRDEKANTRARTNFDYQRGIIQKEQVAEENRKQAAEEAKVERKIEAINKHRGKDLNDAQADALILQARTGLWAEKEDAPNLQFDWTQNGGAAFNPRTGTMSPVTMPGGGQVQQPPKEAAPRDPALALKTQLEIRQLAENIAWSQVYSDTTETQRLTMTPQEHQERNARVIKLRDELLNPTATPAQPSPVPGTGAAAGQASGDIGPAGPGQNFTAPSSALPLKQQAIQAAGGQLQTATDEEILAASEAVGDDPEAIRAYLLKLGKVE